MGLLSDFSLTPLADRRWQNKTYEVLRSGCQAEPAGLAEWFVSLKIPIGIGLGWAGEETLSLP